MKPARESMDRFAFQTRITTRWSDNDVYGHVNNATYLSYFDSVANAYLIDHGGLDIAHGDVIGLVVASSCVFFAPVSFPDELVGALRVDRLGRTSVTYGHALFTADDPLAAAQATIVHVFVDRATRKPVELPVRLRTALERLVRA
ncbi:MAG TPA: thioesterase family protein [Kofleriaceae bacterium]|nr:thioesterase family protein [Kofleriaceae bacterium]